MIISLILAVLLLMHVFFLLSLWRKNFGLVDIAWGLGFIILSLVSYFYHFNSVKNAVILLLVILWGMRLSTYLLGRNWKASEDHRYQEMRMAWGKFPSFHAYFKVFLFQGLLMLIISLPITAGMMRMEKDLNSINILGIAIFFFGWIYEAFADRYLQKFKTKPENRGKICMSGPWKLSRFPNYFGEIILWYGIYLTAVSTSTWWTIVGPLLINLLILKVSGVPLLEKKYDQRPEYREYSARVPRLIPFTKPNRI